LLTSGCAVQLTPLVTIGPNGTALDAGQQQTGANRQTVPKVMADPPELLHGHRQSRRTG
jgi:hypothetical protein